jgi:hypothetical protein
MPTVTIRAMIIPYFFPVLFTPALFGSVVYNVLGFPFGKFFFASTAHLFMFLICVIVTFCFCVPLQLEPVLYSPIVVFFNVGITRVTAWYLLFCIEKFFFVLFPFEMVHSPGFTYAYR